LIVTTINPDINAAIPKRHSYQKGTDEINYNLQDYVELINKLQKYTICNTSYCIRTKHGKLVCRFKYLKEINNKTLLHKDNHE
jgi:hypothetical protein